MDLLFFWSCDILIKAEVLILWLGLAKITNSIFPWTSYLPPKVLLVLLARATETALNSHPENSCHCSWREKSIKRWGQPIISARKISKKKKQKKKQAQPIHINTFLYVKKENRLCGNGNFFTVHIYMCLFFHFFRKSS